MSINKTITEFLELNDDIKTISRHLKKRNFTVGKEPAAQFLKDMKEYLSDYEELTDINIKRSFLESVTNAWEITDASNIFNPKNLFRTFNEIVNFSEWRFKEICAFNKNSELIVYSKPESTEYKKYQEELVRNSLILIGEEYRVQKNLEGCQNRLDQLFLFIANNLKETEDYRPNIILAHCHYYSSKIARFQGNLVKSQKELIAACKNLNDEALIISKNEEESSQDKLNEIQLLLGVLEVSHAWLNFSRGRYESAKHTALNALLMLAGSKDSLTQLHAELVIAATKRATAKNVMEMIEVTEELERLRNEFDSYKQLRLRIKTDYEYVLSLVILDGLLDDAHNSSIISRRKDYLSDAAKTLNKYRKKDKISQRWLSLLYTAESRYLRRLELKKDKADRNFENALRAAKDAYSIAERLKNPLCQVESLLSQGEIYFRMGTGGKPEENKNNKYSQEAIKSLQRADSLCSELCKEGGFLELYAAVKLYLARISVHTNQFGLAKHYLNEFHDFKNIEHAWVHRLEKRVIRESEQSDEEIIRIDSPRYSDILDRLKPLLIKKAVASLKAKNEKVTQESISNAIGITRVTLNKWQEDIRNG
ncbi:MAG TPA: hypothetical protein VF602_00535 [Pedobacter sp.]|jgi:hypothetical protein